MFKLVRYAITTVVFIAALAFTGVIEFTEKGKESLRVVQNELKTALQKQIKSQLGD